jgi:hypothetical protein
MQVSIITDPRGRHESVYLTDEGKVLAKQLAAKYFAVGDGDGDGGDGGGEMAR